MKNLTISGFETLITGRSLASGVYNVYPIQEWARKMSRVINGLIYDIEVEGIHAIARGAKVFLISKSNGRIICEVVFDEGKAYLMTRRGFLRGKLISDAVSKVERLGAYERIRK